MNAYDLHDDTRPETPDPTPISEWSEMRDVFGKLGHYERQAALFAVRRLLIGQMTYGVLSERDGRDFVGKESAEESCDRLNYRAIDHVIHRCT